MDLNYDYGPVPTIKRFAESDAWIRGLMGPFGCLPADTEFLTPRGWKRMDAYVAGDHVAQWDVATEQVSFVEPTAYVDLPATEVIEFNSGSLVMRLSEGHRVPHFNWAGKFQVSTAADIERRPSRRTIPTTFKGHDVDGLGMPDDLIRFAVMMHADGHYPIEGRQATVTLRKARKKDRLRALLERLQITFKERVYKGRPTETIFVFEPPYRGKRFDGPWWSASRRELAIVMDEMPHWDGHEDEMLIYSSAHRGDADFIQYAAHATGRRATIATVTYANPAWAPNYRVQIRIGDNAKNRAQVRVDTTAIRRVPTPDGRMYCFNVPTSYFIARCDGTVFVTGNSGKSSGCVIEIVRRALETPPCKDGVRRSRWGVVRNTYQELNSTTIKTVMQWLPEAYCGRYVRSEHTYYVNCFPGAQIEIVFLALDRPDDIKKLLSLELTGAWVNEAREVPWSVIEALQGRIARFPKRGDVVGGNYWSGLWMDTNPPDTDSKWYRYFEEKAWLKDFPKLKASGAIPLDMEPEEFVDIFQQPSGLSAAAENLENLQPGYYPKLAVGKAPEWVKVYVDGQYGFVVEGKLVYPEYVDQVHCKSVDPQAGLPIIRSWDFGLTPACIFSQVLPDGRWLTFDEMTSDNMGIDQFSDEVLEHCTRAFRGKATFEDWGDPAGEQRAQTDRRTCYEIMHAKGIMIEGSEQDPTMRQEAVRSVLRRPGPDWDGAFILHPRCRMLRKGFMGGYHRRRLQTAGPERYTAEPQKNIYSHPHDALQYGMVKYFAPALRGEAVHDDDWPMGSGHDDYAADATRNESTGY